MKNILLIVRWPVGGIRTYIKYVFNGEEFSGTKITVVAPDVGGLSSQFGPIFPDDRFHYVPCDNSFFGLLRGVWQELRQNKFDIINIQGFSSAMASFLPAALLARKVIKISTIHDVLHDIHFAGSKGRIKRWLMANVLKQYDCIVPVSHDCKENILEFLPEIASTKIRTIVNGVSVERMTASNALPLHQNFGVDGSRLLIGFLGRFMAQKGFRYLVDAVEILIKNPAMTRQPLVLCYGIGGFYREEIAAIKARGLSEYFRFSEHIEDVGSAIKGVDVVAMPSLWEACPLLPMEVLICGTPLIASNCIGLREVVAGTPAWVVAQADGKALANALQAVASDDRRAEFAAYAAEAATRFDVARTRAQLAALYAEFLPDLQS